jgi:hypothetical protein
MKSSTILSAIRTVAGSTPQQDGESEAQAVRRLRRESPVFIEAIEAKVQARTDAAKAVSA